MKRTLVRSDEKAWLLVISILLLGVLPAIAQVTGEYSTDANTVALLHMNEASGSLLTDSSGLGNHGTTTGTTVVAGRFGNGRRFTNIVTAVPNDWVSLGNSPSLNPSNALTVEAWIYPTTNPPDGYGVPIVSRDDSWGGTQGYTFNIIKDPCNGFTNPLFIYDGDIGLCSNASVPINQWSHVAFTLASNGSTKTAQLYLNGQLVGQQTANGPLRTNSLTTYIGRRWGSSGGSPYNRGFDGIIDEVRFSNKVRSATEFNAAPPPTCTLSCSVTAPGSIEVGVAGQFSATSTTANCGTVDPNYLWNFGDGTTSTSPTLSKVYTKRGSYNWTLTATVAAQTCTKTGTITVSEARNSNDLASIQFAIRSSRQRAVSHGGGRSIPGNLVFIVSDVTNRFIPPVTATIEGEPFTDVVIGSDGVLTLAGTPGGRSLSEWLPDQGIAGVTVTNGDGFVFFVNVRRFGATLSIEAPVLDHFSTSAASPAETVTLYGQGFGPTAETDSILVRTTDGREFTLGAKTGDSNSLSFVVPLLPTDGADFYSGPVDVQVTLGTGVVSRGLPLTVKPLPELTDAPGVATEQVARLLSELTASTEDIATASLIAQGATTDQIRMLREFPRAALAEWSAIVAGALNGRPHQIDVPIDGVATRIVIDRKTVVLFERLMLASNASARVQRALTHLRTDAVGSDSTCGPTAQEQNILIAADAYASVDFGSDLLDVVEILSAAITLSAATAGVTLPEAVALAGLIETAELAVFAGHIIIGAQPIQLQTVILNPSNLTVASQTSPASTIEISGEFSSPVFGDTLREAAKLVIDAAVDAALHGWRKVLFAPVRGVLKSVIGIVADKVLQLMIGDKLDLPRLTGMSLL